MPKIDRKLLSRKAEVGVISSLKKIIKDDKRFGSRR